MQINTILRICSKIAIIIIPIMFGIKDYFEKNDFIKSHISVIYIGLIIILLISIIYESINQYKSFKYRKFYKLVKIYRSFISGYFDNNLRELFDKLKYTENERLTLFLYSSSQNQFYPIGRYSKSVKFNKIRRYVIDDEKEYVYNVINEKEEEYSLKSPCIKNSFYKRNKFKMQSNSMYGFPIEINGSKIGVLIAQSMSKDFFTKKRIKSLQRQMQVLQDVISSMNINPNIMPSEIDLDSKGL
ncbi:hypothetical protein [Campylobacter lari]|uniref:hypothetical protein n=1 Tax=Campylobacter lari TaxID=201 RepID=UPI001F088D90|nr:hypothetical protein [Campylobacter lari]EEU8400296.1 hypothetical protein [Campylobacter lari]EGK8038898.1 hypothetical protein [Campylobacter lari]MCH3687663.1 hypothetical protein [Campylobacter lari]